MYPKIKTAKRDIKFFSSISIQDYELMRNVRTREKRAQVADSATKAITRHARLPPASQNWSVARYAW